METFDQAYTKIYSELTSNNLEVSDEYFKLFKIEIEEFATAMSNAIVEWQTLNMSAKNNEQKEYVSGLVYTAITLLIMSFKLFLSGHIIAAGNLFRQVIESIALALLCSLKNGNVLTRFMENKYSTKNVIRDLTKKSVKLNLNSDAIKLLKEHESFYHKYSHLHHLTIANFISFSENALYLGASFDDDKIEVYKKEISARVNLSKTFTNFIKGVNNNLSHW
jgi:hypothetical protein